MVFVVCFPSIICLLLPPEQVDKSDYLSSVFIVVSAISESLNCGRHGLEPECYIQLLLHAGRRLALRGVLLQSIPVHSHAKHLRLGLHFDGHLH